MMGDGLNNLFTFKADIRVLTIEQHDGPSLKLMHKKNYLSEGIFEVTEIDF